MPYIDDILIQITLETKALTLAGFGMPLVLGKKTDPDPLIGELGLYANMDEVSAAGYASSDNEYKMAAKIFAQSPAPSKIAIYTRDDTSNIADSLDAAKAINNDWYAVLIEERDKASIADAGDWAAANEKLFFGCSTDITALDARNNTREAILIHDDAANYPECAWVGLCLPQPIGSITWKWKSPSGVIASNLDTTQLNTVRTNKGQTFSERAGVVYSDNGITTGGEFIDVIQARDYIKTRLGEEIFGLSIRTKKIPYDNSGIAQVEATVRSVLKAAGNQGIIARVVSDADKVNSDEGTYQYMVTVPDRNDISVNDRAARLLPYVEFSFVIAGAIHEFVVNGTITV